VICRDSRTFWATARSGVFRFSYAEQPKPEGLAQAFLIGEEFIAGEPVCLVLGDNLFYGHNLGASLLAASRRKDGATVFGYHTNQPEQYGVVEFDSGGKVVSLEEKPKVPKSNYAVPGIYFYDSNVVETAKNLKPSPRGNWKSPTSTGFTSNVVNCGWKSLAVAQHGWIREPRIRWPRPRSLSK
jgi:dTDP-glucose pyrophosphorylase